MTQVLSGNGRIKEYLYRFNILSDPVCKCDSTSFQSWEHVLFDCAVFERSRSGFIREVVTEGFSWPPSQDLLLKDKRLEKIFQRNVEHLDFDKILLD